MKRQGFQHIFLDFDRTLNDSDLVYERNLEGFFGLSGSDVLKQWGAVHRLVVKERPPKDHENLSLHFDLLLERVKAKGKGGAKRELQRRIKAAQEECWHATALFEESLPFLGRLHGLGYTLHIATGDYAKTKAKAIERQAGRRLFAMTFDEETLGVGKGRRAYFDRALGKLGVAPANVSIVGDSLRNDIAPGLEVGLATVWVRRKNEANKGRVKPHLTVKALVEAEGWF